MQGFERAPVVEAEGGNGEQEGSRLAMLHLNPPPMVDERSGVTTLPEPAHGRDHVLLEWATGPCQK